MTCLPIDSPGHLRELPLGRDGSEQPTGPEWMAFWFPFVASLGGRAAKLERAPLAGWLVFPLEGVRATGEADE